MIDSEADASKAQPESGAHVTRTGQGTHRVELWGNLPVGWLSNFTRGTARMSLDIVRGVARRSPLRRWSATFEMRGTSDAIVQRIDFLELARVGGESPLSIPLELLRFDLTRSTEREGTLELRVGAPDRVGFLAALLGHLAGFVLFPDEIRIDTFQNEADDALFLTSLGGQRPPVQLEAALRASLRLCTRDRA
ncbi:MAG: hypothetical protein ABW061_20480 [Polyangiaceae bacterium]